MANKKPINEKELSKINLYRYNKAKKQTQLSNLKNENRIKKRWIR